MEFRFDYLRSREAILFYVDHDVSDASKVTFSISEREKDIVKRYSTGELIDAGSRVSSFVVSFLLLSVIWYAFGDGLVADLRARDGSILSGFVALGMFLAPIVPIGLIAWLVARVLRPGALMNASPTVEGTFWLDVSGNIQSASRRTPYR